MDWVGLGWVGLGWVTSLGGVDEELSGAGVFSGGSKGDGTALVGGLDWVVENHLVPPLRAHLGEVKDV